MVIDAVSVWRLSDMVAYHAVETGEAMRFGLIGHHVV
jgi:hypothetical protein